MKRFAFFLNNYNDVDHQAPLIDRLLENGHITYVFCFSDYDIRNNVRILHFRNRDNYRDLSTLFQRVNCGSYKFIGSALQYLILNPFLVFIILLVYRIDACIFTWMNPVGKRLVMRIIRASRVLGKPVYCFPHGQNIFLNYDVNHYLRDFWDKNRSWPDFQPRNIFDHYVVQTNRHKELHIKWGMDEAKVLALGSMRFDPTWILKNIDYYDNAIGIRNSTTDTKIVFFLPHWHYNVRKDSCLQLIDDMGSIGDTTIVVKGHTRGDVIGDKWHAKLSLHNNLYINSTEESVPLIEWADVVINFGSSIGVEAIVRGKTVIYPAHLHSNQTVFDNTKAVHSADCHDTVINLIKTHQRGQLQRIKMEDQQAFIIDEVFTTRPPFDVVQEYYRLLMG